MYLPIEFDEQRRQIPRTITFRASWSSRGEIEIKYGFTFGEEVIPFQYFQIGLAIVLVFSSNLWHLIILLHFKNSCTCLNFFRFCYFREEKFSSIETQFNWLHRLTSDLGLLSNHPIYRRSGMALEASWRAAVVRTANAEWMVLNQAAASAWSDARKTQLWTASGECNSSTRFSETTPILITCIKSKQVTNVKVRISNNFNDF